MSEPEPINGVATLTVQLLSAYLSNNVVASEDLAGLIRSTRAALTEEQAEVTQGEPETVIPAVSVRKSLASPEHIISLIDGKAYKTLRRHLMARGLTPDEYRSRYNLPAGYPMVAPAYAEHRRAIAQRTGLGSRKGASGEAPIGKDDQVDDAGSVDSQVSLPEPTLEPESKPRRAKVAKEGDRDRRATTGAMDDEASLATAGDRTPEAGADTSSQAPTSKDTETSQSEAIGRSKGSPGPAPKTRSAKSATRKASQSGRVEATVKAKLASVPVPKSETPTEASDAADGGQNAQPPAQSPKRRAKLGIFKKSDAQAGDAAGGTAPDDAEASSRVQEREGLEPATAEKAVAERKSIKRKPSSAVAPEDIQLVSQPASEDGPVE